LAGGWLFYFMANPESHDFGPEGPLAALLPGYEPREAQAELARAVAAAFDEGGLLLAEAGTGIGKSLAYLMPGLRRALKGEQALLVSTATLTLQAQLLEKDIPLALQALGVPPAESKDLVVRAMGRSNYFCRLRFELLRGPEAGQLFEDGHSATLKKLDAWAKGTPEAVRDRLPFPVDPAIWEKSSVDAYGCLGQQCPHARDCYFLKDRERLKRARVVVANHALLLSDVVARRERSALLPDKAMAVIDEAHHLERMASEHLGIHISPWDLEQALAPVMDAKSGKGLALRLGFPAGLSELVGEARLAGLMLFEEAAARLLGAPPRASLQVAANAFQESLSGILIDAAKALEKATEGLSDEALAAEARSAAGRLTRLADTLRAWVGQEDGTQVYWLEPQGRKGEVALRSAPLDAGAALSAELYPRFKSLVFSSATLATHKGLDFARQRLGLPEGTTELVLGSPFDYRAQVELHLSRKIPDPKNDEPGYFDGLEAAIKKALVKSEGRAFVLFTSFRHLEELAQRLKGFVEDEGWLFLKQDGRTPKEKLLDLFKKDGGAVLFGAASFWEGVDVPGAALSCVIVCKLPFAVPDTPLEKARAKAVEDKGGSAFKDLSLPEAVLRLKQGFGRLIRHSEDRGFIHVLDPRVLSAYYGKAFLRALPGCRLFIDGVEQEAERAYTV
jgi:ATP-dependent DNA helicase DinG